MQILLSEVSITVWLNFWSFPNQSSTTVPLSFQHLKWKPHLEVQPIPTLGPILTLDRNNVRIYKAVFPISNYPTLTSVNRVPVLLQRPSLHHPFLLCKPPPSYPGDLSTHLASFPESCYSKNWKLSCFCHVLKKMGSISVHDALM